MLPTLAGLVPITAKRDVIHKTGSTKMLSKIKLSASGCDDVPVWLLHQCSYELADIVAHIVNCSVIIGTVPSYWLNALVTPVPKPTGFMISALYLLPLS